LKTIWELKQSTEPGTLEMYIYESIEPDGYDWWSGEKIVSETSAQHFRDELGKYPDAKFINLYVNSYGGDVKEAMGIRSQLKRHPAFVTGYVDGFAASAASYILTACDKVVMPSPTMQMVHEMWNLSVGNANAHRKNADDLDAIMAGNRQAYLEKSGGKLNEKQLREIMDAETWLTAEQCLEFGLADEISEKAVDMTKAAAALKQSNDTLSQKNRKLVAKLRQLADQDPEPVPEPEPEPEPTPEPEPIPEPTPTPDPVPVPVPVPEPTPTPQENKTLKLMAALFR